METSIDFEQLLKAIGDGVVVADAKGDIISGMRRPSGYSASANRKP